jgi:hypothetical protein
VTTRLIPYPAKPRHSKLGTRALFLNFAVHDLSGFSALHTSTRSKLYKSSPISLQEQGISIAIIKISSPSTILAQCYYGSIGSADSQYHRAIGAFEGSYEQQGERCQRLVESLILFYACLNFVDVRYVYFLVIWSSVVPSEDQRTPIINAIFGGFTKWFEARTSRFKRVSCRLRC